MKLKYFFYLVVTLFIFMGLRTNFSAQATVPRSASTDVISEPMTVDESVYSTELKSGESLSQLNRLIEKSMKVGKIETVQVIAAQNRAHEIKAFLNEVYPALDVKVYDLTNRPSSVQEILKNANAETRKILKDAGFAQGFGPREQRKQISNAMILANVKTNY